MWLRYSAVAALLACGAFLVITSGCQNFKMIGKKWPDSTQASTTQSTQPSTTQSTQPSTTRSTQPSTTQSTQPSTTPASTQVTGTPLDPDVGQHALRKAAANEPDPPWWPKTTQPSTTQSSGK
jgi:hypothetical protein